MLEGHHLDKETPVPLYYQLKTLLLEEMQQGHYASGDLIPTENELSAMFDISRTTVRQAVTELVREGYLYRIKSKGTFVSKPKIEQNLLNYKFTFDEAIKSSGREPKTTIIKLEVVPMPPELVELGAGTEQDKAVYLYRKRTADNEPIMRVKTYLPYAKFSFLLDTDLERHHLHALMDRNEETRVYRSTRMCEAASASDEDIKVLDMTPGDAVLKLTTVRYSVKGEVLDIAYSYFRGDQNRIKFEVMHSRP